MPSPQKAKGSGYERDVAKFLTELYGESFIRAPGSGAYVGGKNQVRKEVLHE
jgi:Holliday junction resolvase